jgi:hypothetical protein
MSRTIHPRLGLGAVLLVGVASAGAQAQDAAQPAAGAAPAAASAEDQLDRTPEDCILLNRVANNTGVSNQQVVFSMRGGTYYLNVLDGACQALTPGANQFVFVYRTRSAKITRLCETDSFTVERQVSRIGCGLGQFHPITAAEASALLGRPVAPPASSSSNSSRNQSNSGNSDRPSRRERD